MDDLHDDAQATPETANSDKDVPGGEPATTAPPADEAAALREALAAREAEIAARDEANQELLTRLRTALLASDPAVAPDLVRATSVDELETSFAAAKAMADRIRQEVRREVAAGVPAGAPVRLATGPAAPIDKIRAGLRSA